MQISGSGPTFNRNWPELHSSTQSNENQPDQTDKQTWKAFVLCIRSSSPQNLLFHALARASPCPPSIRENRPSCFCVNFLTDRTSNREMQMNDVLGGGDKGDWWLAAEHTSAFNLFLRQRDVCKPTYEGLNMLPFLCPHPLILFIHLLCLDESLWSCFYSLQNFNSSRLWGWIWTWAVSRAAHIKTFMLDTSGILELIHMFSPLIK